MKPRRTDATHKDIRCKVDGCNRRRRVARTSGAKYCRWHSIQRARQWGLSHLKKCNHSTGPKKKCGRRFVPLHERDRVCEAHALPLGSEHRMGRCSSCGNEARLYLSADWCTACLRALGTPPLLTREEFAAAAIEEARRQREAVEAEANAKREAADRAKAEAERARAEAERAKADAAAAKQQERERLERAIANSRYRSSDPSMLTADLQSKGFSVTVDAITAYLQEQPSKTKDVS